jgi:REP element-mobilizing transposase RayT
MLCLDVRYHTRGYLPHWEVEGATQFVTWRQADAMPPGAWTLILQETESLSDPERSRERARRAEALLDAGYGSAAMREPLVAKAVQETLLFGHGKRYSLCAYVVMPNHVHAVLRLAPQEDLSTVLRTIKSYSAKEANRILKSSGKFWQVESFDRLIRTPEHLERTVKYIEWNPVKARLVEDPRHYAYSSANPRNGERLASGAFSD